MIEHLPIVQFIARRIHVRLPQHVPIEDLYSAGESGCSTLSVGSIHLSKFNSTPTRSFGSVEPFSTVCGRWIGVPGICGARGEPSKRQSGR
jgi:hypothetical protein